MMVPKKIHCTFKAHFVIFVSYFPQSATYFIILSFSFQILLILFI